MSKKTGEAVGIDDAFDLDVAPHGTLRLHVLDFRKSGQGDEIADLQSADGAHFVCAHVRDRKNAAGVVIPGLNSAARNVVRGGGKLTKAHLIEHHQHVIARNAAREKGDKAGEKRADAALKKCRRDHGVHQDPRAQRLIDS